MSPIGDLGAWVGALAGTDSGVVVAPSGALWPWLLPGPPGQSPSPGATRFRVTGPTTGFRGATDTVAFRDTTPQIAAQAEVG
jgi:hypothetical protein